MAKTLFDLLWVYPLNPASSLRKAIALDAEADAYNTLSAVKHGVPAIILFPALCTPDTIADDGAAALEILIATKAKIETAALTNHVNWQLKVLPTLDPTRTYVSEPLFGEGLDDKIKVHAPSDLSTARLETRKLDGQPGRFRGQLDERARTLYHDAGYRHVYPVSIAAAALDRTKPWPGGKRLIPTTIDPDTGFVGFPEHRRGTDWQDWIVQNAVKISPKHDKGVDGDGQYGFPIAGGDIALGDADPAMPVVSYHPVIRLDKGFGYATIGHMADIHVSSRQQFLAANPARVIEHSDFSGKAVKDLVNVCSRRTWEIFGAFGGSRPVDVVVIGGDFVDYIRSMYTRDFAAKKATLRPPAVWDLVKLDGSYKNKYHKNIDFLTMFTFLVHFYRQSARPVFAVTGNHDCYCEPYGVSPRVMGMKANEGIPADHNMTFYEAILAFGDTYAEVKQKFNFDGKRLDWFYTVFTPWADFALDLPKQIVLGLAWGTKEDMVSVGRWGGKKSGGQGFGHLPRANTALTATQRGFLDKVCKDNGGPSATRKVILTSHFTFASYAEAISNREARAATWGDANDQGDIYYTSAWYSTRDFGKADMGTFELEREAVYHDLLMQKNKRDTAGSPVQVILTGHSHRRALYTFRNVDYSGNNSVKTDLTDFPAECPADIDWTKDAKGKPRREPWIVLSDSGGSVPRCNAEGEFAGWGSDSPGGTRLMFNPATGALADVQTVRTPAKPRFCVAMDYYDIMVEKVFNSLTSAAKPASQVVGTSASFTLDLLPAITNDSVYGIRITGITLYYVNPRATPPTDADVVKVALTPVGSTSSTICTRWSASAHDASQVHYYMLADTTRSVYIAITFAPAPSCRFASRYSFADPLTREARVYPIVTKQGKTTHIQTRIIWGEREIPDFVRRRAQYS